jgi:Skp family chaperone for outer membrane proteins
MTRIARWVWQVTAVVMVLGLLAVAEAWAQPADEMQPASAPTTRPGRGAGPRELAFQNLRRIAEELDLSLEQKAQIDAIFDRTMEDLQGRRQELVAMDPAGRREQLRQAMHALRQEVAQVLDDQQRQKLREAVDGRPLGGGAGVRRRGADNVQTPGPRQRGQAAGGGGPALQRLSENLDQVGLSDQQKAQGQQIIGEARRQLDDLRDGVAAGDEEARAKAGTVLRDARTQLQALLTPEQQDELRQLMGGQGRQGRGAGLGRRGARLAPASAPSSLADPAGAGPGEMAPALTLHRLDGSPAELSSYRGKVVVLVFGSYSCPAFREHAAGIDALRNGEQARGAQVLVIYTREAHPQGDWDVARNREQGVNVDQPTDLDGRRALAEKAREALGLGSPILLDTMDDQAAKAFSAGPNSAYLIGRDGRIIMRQQWFDPSGLTGPLREALRDG